MDHYLSYRSYLKKRFGASVLKIPVHGGCSCPNRDGLLSREGCSFCDNRSFSPAAGSCADPREQLCAAVRRAARDRYRHFIAYLQPFSNTYGTVQELRDIYEPLLTVQGVVGLAIGTRPDCLPDETCAYLGELGTRTYLSIEIGLQSSHDSTLSAVNRRHTYDDFAGAVRRLETRKIETVAHVMLGLPGETVSMMLETARKLAALPVQGVKIHQMMAIEGTRIGRLYAGGEIKLLTLEQYADILCDFLSLLRPDQHIHRLMADSKPEFGLMAPLWSAKKAESIAYIHQVMDKGQLVQGACTFTTTPCL